MARILVVKPSFPYPPNQGTRRVSLALLRDLATQHEVVYLCQREHRSEAKLIPEVERLGVRVIAPLMPNRISPLHRALYKAKNILAGSLLGIPRICLYWSNAVLRSELEELGRSFRPDLTILESWETFPLRRSIRSGLAVLLAHDAAFQIRQRAIATAPNPRERARREKRFLREKRLETKAWTLFDAILTLTENDRTTIETELARQPQPLVRHLPMPVPDEFFSYGRPAEAGRRIGFLGTFRADFNQDALGHLLRELWPAILRKIPDARLIIAGNGYDGPLKQEALASGAQWLGFVEDLRTYFESIDTLLVPLRFGGGLRIRILEALAASVPVVASPVAVAGLGVADGRHFLQATGPEEVATQIERLLSDPAMASALGERGREWCQEHHGREMLRPRRLDVIREILESAPAPDDARPVEESDPESTRN